MKIQLGVALLISITNLSVCLSAIESLKSTTFADRTNFIPDWSLPPLCEKLKEVYTGEEGLLVLVPIQGSTSKPKIYRKGCFLLQSNKLDGPQNGMIDFSSRYFAPRTYGSIYNNKKLRCSPFIEEKMPENFNPFNETVVTALEALQICKFFSQSIHETGEKRFVPKYMPLVLNVESKLRCIQWAFDYQEQETWVKHTNPGCAQPISPVKKSSVVKAMSEASCQFLEGEITCKPVDKLQTRITRLNLLFASHKQEIREKKAETETEKRSKVSYTNKEDEIISKYVERVAKRQRRNAAQNAQNQPPPQIEFEFKCDNCKRVKKSKRNGNFKINIDSKPKFESKPKSGSVKGSPGSSNKYIKPPMLTVPNSIRQEKREVTKSSKFNDPVKNSNTKSNVVDYKGEAKILAKGLNRR